MLDIKLSVLFETFTLGNKCSFKDDAAFFVALILLGGKLVNPAELGVTVFAGDVSHHVSAGQHDPVLDLAKVQVDHFTEEEGSTGCPREPCRNQLRAVCQSRFTICTAEKPRTTDVVQKYSPHSLSWKVKQE